jgi:hypothetical protein
LNIEGPVLPASILAFIDFEYTSCYILCEIRSNIYHIIT